MKLFKIFVFGSAVASGCVSTKPVPPNAPKEKATSPQDSNVLAPTPAPSPVPSPVSEAEIQEGFKEVPWGEIEGAMDDGEYSSILPALTASLRWFEGQTLSPDTKLSFGKSKISALLLKDSLSEAQKIFASSASVQEALPKLKEKFGVWRASPAAGKNLLVTGYYIPVINGSKRKSVRFPIPVYGVPNDLVTVDLGEFIPDLKGKILRGRKEGGQLVPYFRRSEIRADAALEPRAEILAWASSEWDTFLMEVQGSGVLRLEDGKEFLLSYAEQNGRSYQPVGKLLLQEKAIPREKMSMQAIGSYIKDNPMETRRVLDYNPSFVFFSKTSGGAKGALGFELTSQRSVAVDFSRYPKGAMAFVKTHSPKISAEGKVASAGEMHRLVFNQDTGGAIRGMGRMDFFWGKDYGASEKAGAMQHEGEYYLLLKKEPTTSELQHPTKS